VIDDGDGVVVVVMVVVVVQGITHNPALHYPVSSMRPLSQAPQGSSCMEALGFIGRVGPDAI